MSESYPQTTAASGRGRDRLAGKSRITVWMDEWLFDWIKAEAIKSKRSLSLQAEMILARYADGKIK